MATYETKFGLGQKVWAISFAGRMPKKCHHCGHAEPQYGYEVRKVVITQILWRLQWICPDYSWKTTSSPKDSGSGSVRDLFSTRAEALKALKQKLNPERKQKKRK